MSTCQTFGWSHSWWWENLQPNHIGPQSWVPALPLVHPGGVTYLTKARQVTNELCSPLYTIYTTYRDHLQFCICITLSHILAPNVEKCYQDYFLSRPIYAYLSTISLVYYYTEELLSVNYFCHHK